MKLAIFFIKHVMVAILPFTKQLLTYSNATKQSNTQNYIHCINSFL